VHKRLLTSFLLASMATLAHGQTSTYSLLSPNSTTTVVPVWSNSSGQLEGLLLLEPSSTPLLNAASSNGRVISSFNKSLGGNSRFQASFGSTSGRTVGLFCNGRSSLLTSIDALADHCQLGSSQFSVASSGLKAQAGIQRKNVRLDTSFGAQQIDLLRQPNLPTGFDPANQFSSTGAGSGGRVTQQYLGLNGSIELGNQGWVTIGGTVAKARLIPTSQLSGKPPSEWNSGAVSVSGGRGNIGGEVTGTTIEIAGQAETFRSVGAGITWKTPWRAKLSVGADNLMTRGKNPLSAGDAGRNKLGVDSNVDGAVPFVRYEQDL